MAETIIDTTYFKVTQNSTDPRIDFYRIYPFDPFGNLYKRIQVDVDIPDWNEVPILILVPEIASLNYNFDLEITITNYISPLLLRQVIGSGNYIDQWYFNGALFSPGSVVWTPESYNPAPSSDPTYPYGSWCVVPEYTGGRFPGVASAMIESEPAPEFTIDWSIYKPVKKKPSYLIR